MARSAQDHDCAGPGANADENQTVFEYVTTNFGKAQTPSMAQAVSVESGAKEVTYSKTSRQFFIRTAWRAITE